jgi:hypothetical protein
MRGFALRRSVQSGQILVEAIKEPENPLDVMSRFLAPHAPAL